MRSPRRHAGVLREHRALLSFSSLCAPLSPPTAQAVPPFRFGHPLLSPWPWHERTLDRDVRRREVAQGEWGGGAGGRAGAAKPLLQVCTLRVRRGDGRAGGGAGRRPSLTSRRRLRVGAHLPLLDPQRGASTPLPRTWRDAIRLELTAEDIYLNLGMPPLQFSGAAALRRAHVTEVHCMSMCVGGVSCYVEMALPSRMVLTANNIT